MSLRNETRYRLLSFARLLHRVPKGYLSDLPEDARILVIRPDHIGDILLSTPAIKVLRRAKPHAHLTYLVGPWSKQVLENNPAINKIMTCEFPGFNRGATGNRTLLAPYRQLLQEAEQLRALRFDAAINLRFDFWWGAMLIYFAGIPVRVGYNIRECLPFLSEAVSYLPERHEVLQNLSLVEGLFDGCNPPFGDCPDMEFFPSMDDTRFADKWVNSDRSTGPLINLHPGAGAAVKLWTVQNFTEVANYLSTRFGAEFVITGSAQEASMVAAIAGGIDGKARAFVGASLGQLGAVLRHCDLAIGVDSGPMHLAVAMKIPSVHLYGPVSDKTFGPWNKGEKHIVITSQMDCIPCNRLDYIDSELEQHRCVKRITPESVKEATERILYLAGRKWVNPG